MKWFCLDFNQKKKFDFGLSFAGVQDIDVDIRQQKVTVTGNVDAETLLWKLKKSGKQADLWPEIPDQKEKKQAKPARKEKVIPAQQETTQPSVVNGKEVKPSPPQLKAEAAAQEPPKENQGGGAGSSNGGGANKSGTPPVEESGANGNLKATGDNGVAKELSKSEGKKQEGGSGGAKPPTSAAEEKGGESESNTSAVVGKVGGGNDGGSGRKKKNKGQNGNNNNNKVSEQKSSVAAEDGGSRNHEDGTPNLSIPDHHSHPRGPLYGHYPTQFYGPPPPAPMYATVSYNTAYPTSSYTASYYAPAQPNSYVYSYPGGPELQAPPSDFDPYSTRQPLDSFEMFSDENPNGCLIM